jgi:PAS domain S-box-containing protein
MHGREHNLFVPDDLAEVEDALEGNEGLFRAIAETSPDAIAILDERGVSLYVNPSLARTLGFTRAELTGVTVDHLAHPEDCMRAADGLMRNLTEVGSTVELEARWKHKDGSWRTLDGHSRSFRDRQGRVRVLLQARDVTDAKRARDEVERRAAELDAVFLALHDRAFRMDETGRIVKLLAGRTDDMVLPPEAVFGKLPRECLPAEEAARVDMAWRRMTERRVPTSAEYALRSPDGVQQYLEVRFVPFLERESIAVLRSVTDRRNAEEALRESQERLRASQKMEAIGRLAGGVAHDFNNLLTVILGCTDLLGRLAPPTVEQYLGEIRRAAERGAALTRQLLTFSRKQQVQTRVLDLNAVVTELQAMLQRLIGAHISLTTRLDDRARCRVRADPGQVEQVIVNLVLNARDALAEHGGRIVLSTGVAHLEDSATGVAPGEYAVLRVEDDGPGMTEDVKAHLFEPFFTTKPRGKGTGLGLATVYGIVKQSGGHVAVESVSGVGSTFFVCLPTVEDAVDAASVSIPAARPRGVETVLVVEDEAPLRRLIREILGESGYDVIEASNGEEALRACEQRAARGEVIDLVVSDVVMPGMSGRRLAAHVREKWPKARVLLISGYDDDSAAAGGEPLLGKPFTAQALARRVREVLDA